MRLEHRLLPALLLVSQCAAAQGDPAACDLYRQAPAPPYVLQLSGAGGGTLTYVGVAHTTDISSPSVAEIERQWKQNRPTAVFSEGGVWPSADSREIAVSKYGEGGLLRFLAEHGNVPIRTLEPPAAEETAALLHNFSAEQLKLFYALRQVQEYRRMHHELAPDSFVEATLSGISRTRQLAGKPASIAELEQSVAANLPELKDWRLVPQSYFEPFGSAHWTNSLACQSSQFRDNYMVSLLSEAVLRGERVFSVVGVGHLATQEALLKSSLNRTPN